IGPTRSEEALIFDQLTRVSQLPRGWTQVQDAGRYRLEQRGDEWLFGSGATPGSWKRYLNPPEQLIFSAVLKDGAARSFEIVDERPPAEKLALVGVRPCDLRAIQAQDRVFMGGPFIDHGYKARRENALIIAVNCSQPGGTCFCASTGTGPEAKSGYDLSLTEVLQEGRHFLVTRSGSETGAALLAEVPHKVATADDLSAAEQAIADAAHRMGRHLKTDGLPELLAESYDHAAWKQVSQRCFACGNCTLVCPTCFCSSIEDVTNLSGSRTERIRKWDSCFNLDFSYIHGGSIRTSVQSRYRQWMMHKLWAWQEQFGEPGCVGCGRCITWCPAGIDITEQAQLVQQGAPVPAV
ncbi:MAG: 4Fe-4S dicluster domain-containing protein, partial [Rudaea sp.]